MSHYGGKENADRVAEICAHAHRLLAAGRAWLSATEGPCTCRYPDGSPRYTTADGKMSHRCGR